MCRLLAEEGAGIEDSALLRRHTENFIILCATEYRYRHANFLKPKLSTFEMTLTTIGIIFIMYFK
jgi:hypothetical protein